MRSPRKSSLWRKWLVVKAVVFLGLCLQLFNYFRADRVIVEERLAEENDMKRQIGQGEILQDSTEEEVDLRAFDTDNSQAEDFIPLKPVHITHVFNTFNTKANSLLWKEHRLVQSSWHRAYAFAREKGIEVEFIDAVLSRDVQSVPDFARKIVLKDEIVDPFNKHVLPTIGEIFRVGQQYGHGQALVYTNADIGAMEDFYVKVWKLFNLDPYDEETQRATFSALLELCMFCFTFDPEDEKMNSPLLCREDAKQFFLLHGGTEDLLPHVMRSVALLFVQNRTLEVKNADGIPSPDTAQMEDWYEKVTGSRELLDQDISSIDDILAFKYQPLARKNLGEAAQPSAFTLTRLDLAVNEKVMDLSPDGLEELLRTAKSQSHPGNDCFVMPREMVPKMIQHSRHPLSWRPWGMWIPPTFEWEFPDLVWRRFEGTQGANYTFHLGVSGRIANNWINLFNKRPLFILKLAAEWNNVTNGKYVELFQTPEYCAEERLYRHFRFCLAAPEHMKYCQGKVRYACSKYNNPHLRDPYNYILACEKMIRRAAEKKGQYFVEPYCSFCVGLLKAWGAPKSKIRQAEKKCDYKHSLVDCFPGRCEFRKIKQT